MKLEVIKSYILAILVGISFLLTFSLWSYQSNSPYLEGGQYEEADLGGIVKTKKDLIQPSMLIFSKYHNNFFGFEDPNRRKELFQNIQSWVLYNFRQSDANGAPNEPLQVEMAFPDDLPMEIIPNIFSVNNASELNLLPNMSFQRVYITFKANNTLTIIFLSTDGKTQLKADVNNTRKYDLLKNYIDTLNGMEEYIAIDNGKYPIYIPMKEKDMTKYTFFYDLVDPEIMKNALFIEPSEALKNVSDDNEIWYQDGTRTMQVFKNRIRMEYINPMETAVFNSLGKIDLLDKSIAIVNDYKGWLQDYRLEGINTVQNEVLFRMCFSGYPVFSYEDLSTIEVGWVNDELSEHKRPLFQIDDNFPESYTLNGGRDLVNYLKGNSPFSLEDIQDIQVGYRLYQQAGKLNMIPAWYVKVHGEWTQVVIDDEYLNRKGVS